MEDYLKVGVITTTHGVRGEVKVYPTTDTPERFLDLPHVFLQEKSSTHGPHSQGKTSDRTQHIQEKASTQGLHSQGKPHDSKVDLQGKTEYRELNIENVKFFKNLVILKFREINDMDAAALLRERELWIPREEGADLEEDEYYIADLIGMEVCLEDGSRYGTLKDVLETGANDVYIVTKKDGSEILLPAIHDCILDVDLEENRMTIHLMKGLEQL